ncbi:putative pyruvate decarboxylase [Seiridium unicorne]|uniref:Pyruvate decarboxylase n=1 Tax=Seiridium unicorne TaxID=138068 RepID=A0ABR2VC79_9PEZI
MAHWSLQTRAVGRSMISVPRVASSINRQRWPSAKLTFVSAVGYSATQQMKPPPSQQQARAASQGGSESYTTAFALFEALWEAGITTCFVNVGSDHPSIIEAMIKGKRERPNSWPRTITCPSEITAISMADGHARITGKPQAVLVHVDEAPDQKAIVRQELTADPGLMQIKQTIGRALQFANSTPKGPVYIASAREVLAEEIPRYSLDQKQWVPTGPSALPTSAVKDIATALVEAERPLVITGYSGRDRRTPELLVALADTIPGLRVHDTGGSDMCFPSTHIASEGFRLGFDNCIKDADMIFLLDCDVTWIPSRNMPQKNAKIYHVDCDPLNQQIPVSFFPAHGRWKAESFTALKQILSYINSDSSLTHALRNPKFEARNKELIGTHTARLAKIASEPRLGHGEALDAHNIGRLLNTTLPSSTTYVVEAVTAAQILHDQLAAQSPRKLD